MYILNMCAVCLSTEGKMYNLDENGLREIFNSVARLKTHKSHGLPNFLCMVCKAYIDKFKNFQTKCQKANYILIELLNKNKQITMKEINALDKNLLGLKPVLSYCTPTNSFFKEITFDSLKSNVNKRVHIKDLFIMLVDTLDNEKKINIELTNVLKQEPNEIDYFGDHDYDQSEVQYTDIIKDDNDYLENSNYPLQDLDPLNFEFTQLFHLSKNEQKAVAEINLKYSIGKYKCEYCDKKCTDTKSLNIHKRLHENVTDFPCDICNIYFRSNYFLGVHMSKKHLNKYVCRLCNEVNFDKNAARHHVREHTQKKTDSTKPKSVKKIKCTKKKTKVLSKTKAKKSVPSKSKTKKGVASKSRTKKGELKTILTAKRQKLHPPDFLVYTPVGHEEQYQIVQQRKLTKNYVDSFYKCDKCFRGFRELQTMNNHLKKHDPKISGQFKCDICSLYFKNTRKMYKHMISTHLFRYTCETCNFVCFNRAQAQLHYRWHKNVTYPCPHCKKEFLKSSTRLTHIRIKHPSTAVCNICGHSFVSEIGLVFHRQKAHTQEDIDSSAIKTESSDKLYCADCDISFTSSTAYDVHLGSSSKHSTVNLSVVPQSRTPKVPKQEDQKKVKRPRRCKDIYNNGIATATTCEECGIHLPNDVKARKHYKTEHPGTEFLKRYMCDICGHTTQQYNNLIVHMRTHTNEKPYACNYCGRRFSMPSNRDRHLVVHTGERRYECHHCHRRFTQSSAVKLHIQTVHLKIPYAPWDKKNRKRKKEMEENVPQPEPKFQDTHGQYLNAYISYHDDIV